MSENVNEWKVVLNGVVLGQVLSFVKSRQQVKITSKALDGTVYIQTVGASTLTAKISVFSSLEEKDALDVAEASGAKIQVTYRGTSPSLRTIGWTSGTLPEFAISIQSATEPSAARTSAVAPGFIETDTLRLFHAIEKLGYRGKFRIIGVVFVEGESHADIPKRFHLRGTNIVHVLFA